MDDTAELANRWGIDLEYFDAHGRRQTVEPDVVHGIVAALSADGQASPFGQPGQCDISRVSAYQGDGHSRLWALAVQLYSVRSHRNWGHGDFTDLAALIHLAADIGAAGIGLNPLHALFPDRPEQASPYAPNSRLFLNPLYIDVAAIPEFPGIGSAGLENDIARLRACDTVDYAGVARAKLSALRLAYRAFRHGHQSDRQRDFEDFRMRRGAGLVRFAAFETLRQRFNSVWWEWPPEWRRPDEGALSALRATEGEEVGFHEFVQWNADRQLCECQQIAHARRLPIGLYIDLAVGVDPAGADAWGQQETIFRGLSVGAPPDLLNTAGQDWGLASFNPHRLTARSLEPFREVLEAAMAYAGAVRLDHILGLKRLYVIPRGAGANKGAYLRFPLEAMLSMIAAESLRHRCIVIGEDLGTVPEGFRETLAEWGIWSYLVMVFEREHDGAFRTPDRYKDNALATFATHDLPTFTGWKSGHDLRRKRAIDIDPGETDQERNSASAALRQALAQQGLGDAPSGFPAVAAFLAATRSRLVVVSVEDVLEIQDQVNMPGTVDDYPNWQHRLPIPIEDWRNDERLRAVAAVFAQAGRSVVASKP